MTGERRVDPAFWRDRRVLVTGHTGFKGAWLTLWLGSMGARVTGLSDAVPTTPSLYELADVARDAASFAVDVRDPRAVGDAVREARPEVVLHLAAQPLVRRSFAGPAETYAVNVLGTAHVLDAARTAAARSIVVVTSDKCYAPSSSAHVEDDPLGGDDPYSSSKAAAELVAAAYRSSFGLPVATARAGNVIGGGDWGADRLVPDVLAAALSGRPVEVRNPGAVRPWQHVLNPLAGYLLLAQAVADDPAAYAEGWNFGPPAGDELSVEALVERLGALWDRPIGLARQAGEHPVEAPMLRLSSAKARERLGWRPVWGLDEGLRAVVAWTRAYRDGDDLRATTLGQIGDYAAAAARPVTTRR